LIGGFFVEHLSCRWIFYINLPLGLLALVVIGLVFTPTQRSDRPRIDYAGAASLAVALTSLVLVTSLGGHTWPWSSPELLGLAAAGAISLVLFLWVETRAAEPILPLRLFRNRTFVTACAVGLIVGLAMFGSVTYMPLYLQLVKGVSPSAAGLQLTPMMGGVLLSSTISGQVISRIGRYRMFPIAGTAVMTVALFLLSTLGVATPALLASAYMAVLGLGLGMVMQVLVLAVQNTADYRDLGVATSGTTLFRSAGGSVGVSLFGAIFAASLADRLAAAFPPGTPVPAMSDPAAVAHLAPAARDLYLHAFTAALHPVFLSAAVISALAFALAFLLREAPLRGPRSETIGESFAVPRQASSAEALEEILERIIEQEDRWTALQRIAARIGATRSPDEIWLLIQLHLKGGTATLAELCRDPAARNRVEALAERLTSTGGVELVGESVILNRQGQESAARIMAAYRERLERYLADWDASARDEVREMIERFMTDLVGELPERAKAK
jgi:MFS family permease